MARRKAALDKADKTSVKNEKPSSTGSLKTAGKFALPVKVYAPYRASAAVPAEPVRPVSEEMRRLEQPEKNRWTKHWPKKKQPAADFLPKDSKRPKHHQEKKNRSQSPVPASNLVEREKLLVMWSGVAFFMIVILFAWLFNLDYVFKTGEKESASQEPSELKTAAKEISAAMSELKNGLDEIKTEIEKRATTTPAVATSSGMILTDTSTSMISEEDIRELKEKLESLNE